MRGIAAWMVLTSHYSHFMTPGPSLLQFLWTGVDLFFVISGFVFGPAIFAGSFQVAPYAIKRLFRIYPLYLFSLLLYFLITPDHPDKSLYFVKHLLFLGTTSSVQEAFFFNPAYWSLPVEIEYYLLLPILAWMVVRYVGGLWWILALFLIIRFAIIAGATPFSIPEPNFLGILKIHIPGILIEFLVGVVLYWSYQRFRLTASRYWSIVVLAGGLLLWLALGSFFVYRGDQGINENIWLRAYFSFLCALSYGLILFGLLMLIRGQNTFFILAATLLGNLSYGVYLFHTLILRLYESSGISMPGPVAYLLCASAVLMLSALAHHLIEKPAREFGRGIARKRSRPPNLTACPPQH